MRLAQRNKGNTVRNRVKFRAAYTDYIEAKARIESDSSVGNDINGSANPRGRARISGYVYKQSGINNGNEDDVWVSLFLQLDKNGNLSARVRMGASNFDESVYTDILPTGTYVFPTTILFDTDYTLSMGISGSRMEFKCNSDTFVYDILTTVHEPSNPVLYLESRLDTGGDPDDYGRIAAITEFLCGNPDAHERTGVDIELGRYHKSTAYIVAELVGVEST